MQERLRILVADQNRYHALLVEREVEKQFPSCVISVFHSGEAALEELRKNLYDIGIFDCSLTIDGEISVLGAIRPADDRLPLLLMVPLDAVYPDVSQFDDGLSALVVKDSVFHVLIPQLIEHFLKEHSFHLSGRTFKPRLSLRRKTDMIHITVSTLAHEINNPLMTILAITELLLSSSSAYDNEVVEKIRVIRESAGRMKSTLTHMSNLEHPNVRPTIVGSLIKTEKLETLAESKN